MSGRLCESRYTRGDVDRTCPVCGAKFKARAPKHTYCTVNCRRKATGKRIGRVGTSDVCPECGNTFTVRESNQIYCCKKCRDRKRGRRYYWERGGKEKMHEKATTPRGRMLARQRARARRMIKKLRGN